MNNTLDKLKESLSDLITEYKVIVVENINSVQYLTENING